MSPRLLALALALTLAGCAAAPGAVEPEDASRLAEALGRVIRLDHEARLAAELARLPVATDDAALAPLRAPPDPAEVESAREALASALRDAGVSVVSTDTRVGSRWSPDDVRAARDALVQSDHVFLPPAMPGASDDPGLALARVTARTTALGRVVLGRAVRFRRVLHRGVIVPDYATWRALRTGAPVATPLGRARAPTVFLDREAIERRAGQGPYAALDADALASEVELRQAAYLRFGQELALELSAGEIEATATRARAILEGLHARVMLAALHDGDPRVARLEVLALAESAASPEVRAAARLVADDCGLDDPSRTPDELRASAWAAFLRLARN